MPDGSGLVLEVKPNGVKAWRYRFKRNVQGATTFESVAHEWLAVKDWESVPKKHRLDMLQRVVFGKVRSWQ